MNTKTTPKSKLPAACRAWSEPEREAFRAGDRRFRNRTVPAKRKPGPSKKEWS